ncbi:MAG: hypothetical protein IK052_03120 [Bacteroidales bacterium]|nr:hypothetical protein [Bacteroidales bacterium]
MRKLIGHIRNSLPTKISLSMFCIVLLVFILANGVSMALSQHHFHPVAMNSARKALNTAVARAERYLRSVENATNITAWIAENKFRPDSLMVLSRRIVEQNGFISGCSISAQPYVFPQEGRYFSAYTVRKGEEIFTVREDDYEYFDYDWYSKAASAGHAVWIDPFMDDNEGSLSAGHVIASYCRPLYGRNNRLVGVISTDFSLPELSRAMSSEKPYRNSYFILLGHDGLYFDHPDTTRILTSTIFDPTDGHYFSDKLALGRNMITGKSGTMHADVAGVHCLICYEPVPGTNWSAALVSPEKDVLLRYRLLDISILLIVFFALLFILFICRRTVVRAFAPMTLLERQARLITDGDYFSQMPPGNPNSVIGTLQNSFAYMQEVLRNDIIEINKKTEDLARHNDELEKATAALEEALRRRCDFVSNMTHQIRTPLNLVMGFAQLLRDSGDGAMPPQESRRIIHVIDYNAMILRRMSLMLYDSSDRGYHDEIVSLAPAPVSPNEVARECIGYTNRYFPDAAVKLETSLEDSFTIVSDHLYLMRSIREILYNSAKYSDGQNISLHVSANKTRVRFVFEDTGKGINEGNQESIFNPFYKWDSFSEGLGIGLPLTKRHVILLGGTLELDSDYRKGCRFIMEIPVEAPTDGPYGI